MSDQLMPQAPEMERAVLGALMLDEKAICEVIDLLVPEAFYIPQHCTIFDGILSIYKRSEPVDILTVWRETKSRGVEAHYLAELTNGMASYAHIQRHTLIIMEQFIAREVIRLNSDAMAQAYDGVDALDLVPDTVEKMEARIAASVRKRAESFAHNEAAEMERMNEPQKVIHSTGYDALDRVVGGYRRGDLTTIAARPAMGKSSLMFGCAARSAERGHSTGIISIEIGRNVGQARLFARTSGVPLKDILDGKMTADQIMQRHRTMAELDKLPLFTRYDPNMGLVDIRSEATRMVKQHGVGCVFIDQLNWIKPPKGQNRDAQVGEITRTLKNVAMDLDIAVVLLHQLNREVTRRGGDMRPKMTDLRDSGNVEQDSQLIILPHRPEYYGITEDEYGSTVGVAEVIVAKNSNGPCEVARLRFDGPTASFHDLQSHGYQQYTPPPRNEPKQTDMDLDNPF